MQALEIIHEHLKRVGAQLIAMGDMRGIMAGQTLIAMEKPAIAAIFPRVQAVILNATKEEFNLADAIRLLAHEDMDGLKRMLAPLAETSGIRPEQGRDSCSRLPVYSPQSPEPCKPRSTKKPKYGGRGVQYIFRRMQAQSGVSVRGV